MYPSTNLCNNFFKTREISALMFSALISKEVLGPPRSSLVRVRLDTRILGFGVLKYQHWEMSLKGMLNMAFLHFWKIFVAFSMLLRNDRAHEILKNFRQICQKFSTKWRKNLDQTHLKSPFFGYAQKSNFGHPIGHYSPLSLVKTV